MSGGEVVRLKAISVDATAMLYSDVSPALNLKDKVVDGSIEYEIVYPLHEFPQPLCTETGEMVTTHFDIGKITKEMSANLEDKLTVIGAQCVSWASDQLRANGSVVTSNLVNSVNFSTSKRQGRLLGKTKGKHLTPAEPLSVKIGSTVVYAMRVEMGFVGTDSLGRHYNQQPKPYLRPDAHDS